MENYYITPNGNMISGRRFDELAADGKTEEEIFTIADKEQHIIDELWKGAVLKSVLEEGFKKEN